MKRFLMPFFMLATLFFISNAQQLNYNDFIYLTKINDGEFLFNFMSAKHYELTSGFIAEDTEYNPEGASSDDEDVTIYNVVWCYNCTYDLDKNHFEYVQVPFSYLALELKRDWFGSYRTIISYLFPDRIQYESFIKDAKNDGFIQKNPDETSTSLRLSRTIVYDKPPIQENGLVYLTGSESLHFYIDNGYYKLQYDR